jgi:hypothetical protein
VQRPEPADSLRDKWNVSGGWLRSLTFAFGGNMKTTLIMLLLAGVCFAGCGKREENASMHQFNASVILKVSVLQSGKLLADGNEITLDSLDARLAQLKSQHGVVRYYREGGQGEPPPVAMEVMKLVVKHSVPVSMSSKADFSDTIDERGISRPRK